MPHLTFPQWKKAVSAILVKHTMLSLDDYPDWLMHDAWEDGATPSEGAVETLEASDMIDIDSKFFYDTIAAIRKEA